MQAIILAGGKGKRLWPSANIFNPKPFIKVNNDLSLIQETYLRCKKLKLVSGITTIAQGKFINKINDHYSCVTQKTDIHTKNNFIAEPCIKDTAAAITAAALYIEKLYGSEQTMLILPSDHVIKDIKQFESSVQKALNLVKNNKIVTLGVKPNRPYTDYGYIKYSDSDVEEFIEKPKKDLANILFQNKKYLWNTGMFCFKAGCFLTEMEKHSPEILQAVKNCINLSKSSNNNNYNELKLDSNTFAKVEAISIDYALMEKSNNIAVVSCDFDWRDVGNWGSINNSYPSDHNGNKINGSAELSDVENCYIENNGKNIAVIGVNNLAIIHSDTGVLVAHKDKFSEVKNLSLKEHNNDSKFFWGEMKKFIENDGPKIRQITVLPGMGFRIKDYFKFSANWLIVSGFAEFFNNISAAILTKNESKFISSDMDSYLINVGSTVLTILSVQLDEYL